MYLYYQIEREKKHGTLNKLFGWGDKNFKSIHLSLCIQRRRIVSYRDMFCCIKYYNNPNDWFDFGLEENLKNKQLSESQKRDPEKIN